MSEVSRLNPALIETTRGGRVESRHCGALTIADAQGRVLLALGDVVRPIFPRSALKMLQALPLIESGAGQAFGLSQAEIAVACASHGGEPAHVEAVRSLLAKAGVGEDMLACGPHWPINELAARALARSGRGPQPIHNNCSGKHAGMLATARYLGWDLRGYEKPGHPVQVQIRETVQDLIGVPLAGVQPGIDGCSVPTWPIPLAALATAFARLATGTGLSTKRADAARAIVQACFAEPLMVAGSGRLDSIIMQELGGLVLSKGGAEGVQCAAVTSGGLGIAIKIDDGAKRAAEAVLVCVLTSLVEKAMGALRTQADGELRNWRGDVVGRIQASPALANALNTFADSASKSAKAPAV